MTDALLRAEAEASWLAAVEIASGAQLSPELIAELMRASALLLKVAKVHPSPDARAAERWLSLMGLTTGFAQAALDASGGMGAVAPMVTRRQPSNGSKRAAGPLLNGICNPRPDQQKKTPASVGTTPGALTNIGDCNVDRADCRS